MFISAIVANLHPHTHDLGTHCSKTEREPNTRRKIDLVGYLDGLLVLVVVVIVVVVVVVACVCVCVCVLGGDGWGMGGRGVVCFSERFGSI